MNSDLKTDMTSLVEYVKQHAESIDKAIITDDDNGLVFLVENLYRALNMAKKSVDQLISKPDWQIEMESDISANVRAAFNNSDILRQRLSDHGIDAEYFIRQKIDDQILIAAFLNNHGEIKGQALFDYRKMLVMHLAAVHQSEGVNFIEDTPMFGATEAEITQLNLLADEAESLRN